MQVPRYTGKGIGGAGRAFFRDPLDFVLRRQAELGPIYCIRIPFRDLYICSQPDLIREVLVDRNRLFRKSVAYREMRIALGNGLLISEGDLWLRQRRLMQPAFHRSALANLYRTMREETEGWLDAIAPPASGEALRDMLPEMTALASSIAMRTLFSTGDRTNNDRAARQITDAQAYILWRLSKPWFAPFFRFLPRHRRFLQDMVDFDTMVYGLIAERRRSGEHRNDLLDLLLHARDEDTGEPMDDRQLRDEVLTLYVAGHETSANVLAWACHLLATHPEWQDRLAEEALQGFQGTTPSWEELQAMPLVRQVTEETLRLYPPAHAIGREAREDMDLAGLALKEGNIMFMSVYALHRNPALWEAPDEFRPERFSEAAVAGRHKYAYLPFGAGPRLCIGAQFALQEIPLALAALVRRYRLEAIPGETVVPTGLLTLKPYPGVRVRLRDR